MKNQNKIKKREWKKSTGIIKETQHEYDTNMTQEMEKWILDWDTNFFDFKIKNL